MFASVVVGRTGVLGTILFLGVSFVGPTGHKKSEVNDMYVAADDVCDGGGCGSSCDRLKLAGRCCRPRPRSKVSESQ